MMRTTLADLVFALPPTLLPSATVAEAAVTIDWHRISCVLVALNPQNQVNYANAAAHALCTWHVSSPARASPLLPPMEEAGTDGNE